MSRPAIATTSYNDNRLHLSEYHDGFWLFDDTRGMNLSIRAKTPEQAFTEALKYYQDRLREVENNYKRLQGKVTTFVESLGLDSDD